MAGLAILRRMALPCLAAAVLATPASAQGRRDAEPAGDPSLHPPFVRPAKQDGGFRIVNLEGRTLYMLDPRDAGGRAGTVLDYCVAACAQRFTTIAADPAAPVTGLWKPQQAKSGWIWTYRNSPVFTDREDRKACDVHGDGYDSLFHVIEWIPPVPEAVVPAPAAPLYVAGSWILGDGQDHALYTARCTEPCAAAPFRAGLAAAAMGDWTILSSDAGPQWAWRGHPVFVSAAIKALPDEKNAQIIRIGAK